MKNIFRYFTDVRLLIRYVVVGLYARKYDI